MNILNRIQILMEYYMCFISCLTNYLTNTIKLKFKGSIFIRYQVTQFII